MRLVIPGLVPLVLFGLWWYRAGEAERMKAVLRARGERFRTE